MDQLTSTYLAKQDWEAAAELYPNTSKKRRRRRKEEEEEEGRSENGRRREINELSSRQGRARRTNLCEVVSCGVDACWFASPVESSASARRPRKWSSSRVRVASLGRGGSCQASKPPWGDRINSKRGGPRRARLTVQAGAGRPARWFGR
jgi:hypothetical protein